MHVRLVLPGMVSATCIPSMDLSFEDKEGRIRVEIGTYEKQSNSYTFLSILTSHCYIAQHSFIYKLRILYDIYTIIMFSYSPILQYYKLCMYVKHVYMFDESYIFAPILGFEVVGALVHQIRLNKKSFYLNTW